MSVLLEPEPTEPIHEHDYVFGVENKVNILPAEIYFENGKLMVTVYIANNTDHNVTGLSVQKMQVYDKYGNLVAEATFPAQGISVGSYKYKTHTYEFAASTIASYKVDLSEIETIAWLNQ